MTERSNRFSESSVEIPTIKVGERPTLETLINEDALLFAKYLRNEKKEWTARIAARASKPE